MGKLLGGFIAFLGIGIFALPTGILASGFADEIQKKTRKRESLPALSALRRCFLDNKN
ncbi:MAG TPA: hypothetical protein VGP58_00080 [Pyrinomonadaceae bacterium]|jgi:voltage-gated potassium channel|nr:hypothetical protein [Pyrinomonadaceae bacterium]